MATFILMFVAASGATASSPAASIRGSHMLAVEEVRQSLQDSMQEEHGWLIKGLEPHGHQADMSQVHEVNILQDKAPALVESLLEAQRKGRGLALADAVAMLATLERLIFEEAVILLQAAYRLNSIAPVEQVDERAMHEVLSSYLVLFEMGQKADLNNTDLHRALKARAAEVSSNWPLLVEFEQDSLHNYVYANKDTRNPFVGEELFDFEDAVTIVEGMAHGYGKWQNTECQQMKHELMDLDSEGNGLVPLGRFYSQPENAEYHFTETREYLRQIGALQEAQLAEEHLTSQVIVEDVLELSWSDQELLVVQETPKANRSVFRMLMQLTLLLGLLHTTMRNCSTTMAAAKTNSKGKSSFELPF
eukprot:s796_g10.t1